MIFAKLHALLINATKQHANILLTLCMLEIRSHEHTNLFVHTNFLLLWRARFNNNVSLQSLQANKSEGENSFAQSEKLHIKA